MWIDRESSYPLDSFSTAYGSIELLLAFFDLSLDRSSTAASIDILFSRHLSRQMSRHLSTPLSVKIYWGFIYRLCAIWTSFLSISLLIALSPLLSNHSLSLQTSFPSDFQACSRFSLHLLCFFSLFYMHFTFWNLGFGVFEKFWGFSKLMSYRWNFGMGFHLNEFKISCIASH